MILSPGTPISEIFSKKLVEGQPYQLAASCQATGRPLPRLSWDTELNGQSRNRTSDGRAYSDFYLHPTKNLNGKKLDCLVWHPSYPSPKRIINNLVVLCEYSRIRCSKNTQSLWASVQLILTCTYQHFWWLFFSYIWLFCFKRNLELCFFSPHAQSELVNCCSSSQSLPRCRATGTSGPWVWRMLPWGALAEETPNLTASPGSGTAGRSSLSGCLVLPWLTVWCVWSQLFCTEPPGWLKQLVCCDFTSEKFSPFMPSRQ